MIEKIKSFAVLGAGNGGQAMAAYLALKGYKVNLYNRSSLRLESIKKEGGIYLCGVYHGFGKLNKITTDIEEALEGVEVILVVTPAFAHRFLAKKISPYLRDNQIILLNPGRTAGALEFYNTLQSNDCKADFVISEAQTFLYASRVIGQAQVKIFGVKNKVAIAAFPSTRTREIVERLVLSFPQFYPVENVLKTSLDNIGAIFHPAPTLLNMAWIESTGGKFAYYQQGITPSIVRILEELDKERMNVAFALGIKPFSASDWLRMTYGAKGRNLYELLQNNQQYQGIGAPTEINHRYIFEDVPMSLVPIASLGRMLGVKTPTIEMIINLANLVCQIDFWQTGRTVESLGLSGLTVKEIINLVNNGITRQVEILPHLRRSFYEKMNVIFLDKIVDTYQREVD